MKDETLPQETGRTGDLIFFTILVHQVYMGLFISGRTRNALQEYLHYKRRLNHVDTRLSSRYKLSDSDAASSITKQERSRSTEKSL